jgi:hypothetical protein
MRLDGLREAQAVAAFFVFADHLGGEAGREFDRHPRPGALARLDEGVPLALAHPLDEQQLHPAAAGGAAGEEPRRDHPRVIEHQQVARPQQAGQVADPGVALGADVVEEEQAALAARGGFLGDARRRQVVVEVADRKSVV